MTHSAKVAFAAVALAFAAGAGVLHYANNTPEDGADYLRSKGFTNVTGGERVFFVSCGKGSIAREYKALDINGHYVAKTVCGGLFGKYAPLLESHKQPAKLKP
jgi:hypothetical protein